jgi:hypothetical protein
MLFKFHFWGVWVGVAARRPPPLSAPLHVSVSIIKELPSKHWHTPTKTYTISHIKSEDCFLSCDTVWAGTVTTRPRNKLLLSSVKRTVPSLLRNSFTLKMEATGSSITLANYYTAHRHTPENIHLHINR